MRLGAFKYISPLRYVGIKLFANAFYSATRPARQLYTPEVLRLPKPRPVVEPVHCTNSFAYPIDAVPVCRAEKPWTPAKPKRIRGYTPMFDSAPGRPAMVKRDGGLRGSKVKWRG